MTSILHPGGMENNGNVDDLVHTFGQMSPQDLNITRVCLLPSTPGSAMDQKKSQSQLHFQAASAHRKASDHRRVRQGYVNHPTSDSESFHKRSTANTCLRRGPVSAIYNNGFRKQCVHPPPKHTCMREEHFICRSTFL